MRTGNERVHEDLRGQPPNRDGGGSGELRYTR